MKWVVLFRVFYTLEGYKLSCVIERMQVNSCVVFQFTYVFGLSVIGFCFWWVPNVGGGPG